MMKRTMKRMMKRMMKRIKIVSDANYIDTINDNQIMLFYYYYYHHHHHHLQLFKIET